MELQTPKLNGDRHWQLLTNSAVLLLEGTVNHNIHNNPLDDVLNFGRAQLDFRPGEAILMVQSATPDLYLRD